MANRPRFPGSTGNPAITGEPPIEPVDVERMRQIQLLNEAVLVAFAAAPNPRDPWEWSTLTWDITMPTTVIPGVHVDIFLFGEGEQIVPRHGDRTVKPYGETTYTLVLRTPLATRQLGQVILQVDNSTFIELPQRIDEVRDMIRAEIERAFPDSGKARLRDEDIDVDFGINSFVVDIPLTIDVPNWFDADVDMSLGYQVFPVDGQVAARYSFSRTEVSFGAASAIFSSGCTVAVAKALEEMANGFFDGFIGPAVAIRIRNGVQGGINAALTVFNQGRTTPYKLYDFNLTQFNLLVRLCPVSKPPAPPNHGDVGGGGVGPVNA